MKYVYTLFLLIISMLFNTLFAEITTKKKLAIKKIASHTTSHSHIKLIEMRKCLYIIKQKINTASNHKSILKTVLLSELIRKHPLLHIQEVDVIAAKNYKYPKHYKNLPASMHKVVPGKSIREWVNNFSTTCPKFFFCLRLQQRKKKQYCGLTRALINMMTHHKELPAIVACNTLFGDYDCHRKNIFYEGETDQFFLIDMDSTFKCNLCNLALKNIKKFIKEKIHLSKKEIKVLKTYASLLESLIERYPIDKVIGCARNIVKKFKSKNEEEEKNLTKEIENIARFLEESYKSARQLIQLIYSV